MGPFDEVQAAFEAAWPEALAAFSPYTRLQPPIYCHTVADEKREGLSESFAMIRIRDDRIVIGLRQVAALELTGHARAILAHEVGHYVHAPGTLLLHTRLHDRIRRMLPRPLAAHAGLVANLYTDLLLNDRLQREARFDVAAVYRALRRPDASPLFTLYTRVYERLWALPTGRLGPAPSPAIEADAELAARIVRVFRDRWMDGAPSFALLVAPYLEDLPTDGSAVPPWLDTAGASIGDRVPDGLLEDDFDPDGVLHPAIDGAITDLPGDDGDGDERDGEGEGAMRRGPRGRAKRGDGRPDARKVVRGPMEWLDVLSAVGVRRDRKELVARYYRELAVRHVIPFPAQRIERAGDPLPEGIEPWEAGAGLERIDWFESLVRSPVPIPGVSIVSRTFGVAEGGEPDRRVPDLYVGIDCSGSMGNPAVTLQHCVVAGVVLTLSALRAGARVMACLSGEWHGQGEYTQTPAFTRDEDALLGVLTDYLGTGASFGLDRLVATFANKPPRTRPVHVLVVSDSDLFGEIAGTEHGWELAKSAVQAAGGGGTAVLRLASSTGNEPHLESLRAAGLEPHIVTTEPDLVAFARAFSRRTFGPIPAAPPVW